MRINPSLVSPALTLLYRAWIGSMRFDDQGGHKKLLAALDAGRPAILAIWHAELFALTGFGMTVMAGRLATVVSESRDGELIAQVLERIGYGTARGSSTRGGLKALISLKKHMDAGLLGVITVDGPRGPRHKVKDGAVYLALRSGALLFPGRALASREHVFERSWDRFQLPMPFSRCRIAVGDPIAFEAVKPTPELMAEGAAKLEAALAACAPHP